MGTTPNLGIQYPDGSAAPTRENLMEAPIKSVDTRVVAYLRAHFKRGRATGTIPIGQSYFDVPVTFPGGAFANLPTIVGQVSTVTTQPFAAVIQSNTIATTGFTVRLMRPTGSSTTAAAGLNFDYQASDL